MFICKICGSEVEAGQAFCSKCGADVADNYETECPSCGTLNNAGSRYCLKCGNILGLLLKPVCVICGAKNFPGAKFCVSCGAPLPLGEETHNSLDVIEARKAKLKLDIMVKERMKGIDKEIADKRAKMLDDKEKGMKEVDDYRKQANAELSRQSKMLDSYREKINEMGSEDVAKLRKISANLKELATYYSDPYSEIDEDDIEAETYVCPACGTINALSVTACRHCGRNKARSTLLLAKGKIKQSPPVKRKRKSISAPEYDLRSVKTPTFEEYAGEEFQKSQTKHIEIVKADEISSGFSSPSQQYYPQYPFYPYPPTGSPYGAGVIFNKATGESYQMPPIVQPVAFVPYVTQDQPLMQYAPAQDNAKRPAQNETNVRAVKPSSTDKKQS